MGRCTPAPQYCGALNGLFVITDAAAQIADSGYEAHLRRWGFVGTRPHPHVADLSDLTFRLLIAVVKFLANALPLMSLKVLVSTPIVCALALLLPMATVLPSLALAQNT